MNREILYRGLDKHGNWHYGFVWGGDRCGWWIKDAETLEDHRAKPETIGQYTGLKDSEGVKIFEGDVWQRGNFIGVVTFERAGWNFVKHQKSRCYEYPYFHSNASTGKVIGNIHQDSSILDKTEQF